MEKNPVSKQQKPKLKQRVLLQSYLTMFCAEESNKILIVSEEHGLGPPKASVQNQAPMNDTPVGAGRPQQIAQGPAALLAKPEDSQYPERYQLVVQDGQEKQHAAEEGGWP